MDTISNLATAASKAIWGEGQHEEPVSGKMGNVAAGEPYDAGNIEDNEAALRTTGTKATDNQDVAHIPSEPAPTSKTTGIMAPEPMRKPESEAAAKPRFVEAKDYTTQPAASTSATGPANLTPSAIPIRDSSTQAQAQTDTRLPPSSSTLSKPDTTTPSAFPGTEPTSTTTATNIPGPGTPATTTHSTTSNTIPTPSTTTPTRNQQQPTTATPATTTSTTTPSIQDHHAEVTDKKNRLKDDSVPHAQLVGPGPRPLEEIARKHGGDAGAVAPAPAPGSVTGGGAAPAPGFVTGAGAGAGSVGGVGTGLAGASGGAAAAGAAGQQRRDSGKSVGAGAAEEERFVKSSGLAADGGDFDAARPGAGREADRLLDEKGVQHGNPHGRHGAVAVTGAEAATGTDTGHGTENGGKEKVGLKDKIKAKLHKSSTAV